MKPRTVFIFAAFMALAMLAIIFTFAYNGFMGQKLQNYIRQIAQCSYLDEKTCGKNPQCQPIFKQYTDKNGAVDFKNCVYLSQTAQTQNNKDKQLCATTGGQWQAIKYGSYCDCQAQSNTMSYEVGRGCVEK